MESVWANYSKTEYKKYQYVCEVHIENLQVIEYWVILLQVRVICNLMQKKAYKLFHFSQMLASCIGKTNLRCDIIQSFAKEVQARWSKLFLNCSVKIPITNV